MAENEKGYENLCYLTSKAYLEGFYRKPRIDKQLLSERSEGLIALTACLSGEIPVAIKENRPADARRLIEEYIEIMGRDNLFIEIQKNGIPLQNKVNEELVKLSRKYSLPLVATNDVHYLKPGEYDFHDTLLCIGQNKLKQDPGRRRYDTDSLFLRSPQEMRELFADLPEAVENTVHIANRCNVTLELEKFRLPKFDIPEGYDETSYFEKLVREGFERRISRLPYEINRDEYERLLEHETGIIRKMDFCGYFLIVADFINWAKENDIPVGPGRGSGVGSIVAYSLGITDLDPIPYKLLFERFLNPDRVSMPDFDVDFCKNKRSEVIRYVAEKYGEKNVGQIITFGSLKARAVVRDVCRAFDIHLSEANRIAKLVPETINTTLESALEDEPRLGELLRSNPDYQRMYETAKGLEGLHRHSGVHAAGLVIAEKPLYEIVPVKREKGGEGLVTQYAKDEIESIGLVKFDFLGLKTLTVIDEAVKLIRQRGVDLDMDSLAPDDPKVYKLISSGATNGIFQMENAGFQRMLKRLRPNRFEDIILAVSIYRPGPMENIPHVVNRKHGREKIKYISDTLEPILKETYGMIVYQEQVMQIAAEMAGLTMAQADILRKAMGKKKFKLMKGMLDLFKEGALEKGFKLKVVEKVMSDMVEFARYGFNKSHAAAYAMIAYRTAYLKTYHPLEFLAATLTCAMEQSTDEVVKFIHEAKAMNISILPPSVLQSRREFTVKEEKIRYGLGAVKGVGDNAIEAIMKAREGNDISTLYKFTEHVELTSINKNAMEALIKAGAFDHTGMSRSRTLAAMVKAIEYGRTMQKERDSMQISMMDLFGGGNGGSGHELMKEEYPEVEDWTEQELLEFEEESLGLYLSAHPMDRYAKEVRRYCRMGISDAAGLDNSEAVTLAGVITGLRDRATRDGSGRIAHFNLQDSFATIECNVFPRAYDACAPYLGSREPMLVSGFIRGEGEAEEAVAKVTVKDIKPLINILKSDSKRVNLHLPEDIDRAGLDSLRELLKHNEGDCPVVIHLRKEGEYEAVINLPNIYRVEPNNEVFQRAEMIVGKNRVVLE